jgi:hypothetical protein
MVRFRGVVVEGIVNISFTPKLVVAVTKVDFTLYENNGFFSLENWKPRQIGTSNLAKIIKPPDAIYLENTIGNVVLVHLTFDMGKIK